MQIEFHSLTKSISLYVQIADCLNEIVYPDQSSIDRAMSECLYFVRDHDDIEDEEEDGGLQRPWLSCSELIKVFTADPPLNFLSWMDLWFTLPQTEKSESTTTGLNLIILIVFFFYAAIHNVKCCICNKKSIVGFRYQCSECSNYHMCQVCTYIVSKDLKNDLCVSCLDVLFKGTHF